MQKTSRRKMLLAAAAAGGTIAGLGTASKYGEITAQGQGHDHGTVDGPLASTTISFGQWPTEPPFDRFPNVLPTPAQNVHLLTPNFPTIKAGGSVNFIIAGLHNVQIFEPGIKPEDVNTGLVTPMTGPAPFTGLPIINDPVGRIYRGPDPSLLPLDRTEVVQLTEPGTYLVICGFLFHFQGNMFGHIKVLPA
jgi:plastocyanin